jgi:hypothetical protein
MLSAGPSVRGSPVDLARSGWALPFAATAMIVASIVLPTGSVMGFPVKHLIYVIFIVAWTVTWGRSGDKISPVVPLVIIGSAAFVFLYMLIAVMRGFAHFGNSLSEAVGLFSTISLVVLIYLAVKKQWVMATTVLNAIFFGSLLYGALKVLAVIGMYFGVFSFPQVYNAIAEIFGYRVVSSLMPGGFVRLSLIIYDFVVLSVLCLVLLRNGPYAHLSRTVRAAFVVVALTCTFFAYSRFLFLVLFLSIAVVFVIDWTNKSRFLFIVLLSTALLLLAPSISETLSDRFLSEGVQQSDALRAEQTMALLNAWSQVYAIGGGFGYFASDMIRDPSAPHSYEVQWLGFLMKFGMIGFALVSMLVFALVYLVWTSTRGSTRTMSLWLLGCFLAGGFTNQYLITSGAAVVYLMLVVAPMTSSVSLRLPRGLRTGSMFNASRFVN